MVPKITRRQRALFASCPELELFCHHLPQPRRKPVAQLRKDCRSQTGLPAHLPTEPGLTDTIPFSPVIAAPRVIYEHNKKYLSHGGHLFYKAIPFHLPLARSKQ